MIKFVGESGSIHWATNFWSCFFYFLVLLDVFWCAESENDVTFSQCQLFFCNLKIPELWKLHNFPGMQYALEKLQQVFMKTQLGMSVCLIKILTDTKQSLGTVI